MNAEDIKIRIKQDIDLLQQEKGEALDVLCSLTIVGNKDGAQRKIEVCVFAIRVLKEILNDIN